MVIRAGGKYTASHTTCIPAAAEIADMASARPEVYKIALGIIRAGLRPGPRRLKICTDVHAILLKVRGSNSTQELYVYSRDSATTKLAVAEGAGKRNFKVQLVEEAPCHRS